MNTTKTAISLPKELLTKTDKVAQETGNTRSGLIAIAISEYLQRLEREKMLAQLNEVYDEPITLEESNLINAAKTYVAKNVIQPEEW